MTTLTATFEPSPAPLVIIDVDPTEELKQICGDLTPKSLLSKAIRAGELLTLKKGKLSHGQWLPWLKENSDWISQQTASRYMRCYERRVELLSVSSLTEAYRLLFAKEEPEATDEEQVHTISEPLTTVHNTASGKKTFVPRPPAGIEKEPTTEPEAKVEVISVPVLPKVTFASPGDIPSPPAEPTALEADEIIPPENRPTKLANVGNIWDRINLFEKLKGELESIAERAKQLDDHRQKDLCSFSRSTFNYREWQKQ